MTHTALDPDTSGRTPAWLVEGVAMYVSNDDRRAEARGGPSLRELCRPNSIYRAARAAIRRAAYAVSSAAAEAIAARHGSKGLFDVYDAFNDSTINAATCARRPTACSGARSACRSPNSTQRPPAADVCHAGGMPELPEVETIRRHLAPHVEGRVLRELEVLDPRWCGPLAGEEVAAAVEGRRVEALARRGKYLSGSSRTTST